MQIRDITPAKINTLIFTERQTQCEQLPFEVTLTDVTAIVYFTKIIIFPLYFHINILTKRCLVCNGKDVGFQPFDRI